MKRSKVCGKLSANDADETDLLIVPLAAEDKSQENCVRNDQTALIEVSVQSL